jgi:DNA-binding NarL/FixJ family response regulator
MNNVTAPPISLVLADDNTAILATLVEMLQSTYNITAALPNAASVLEQVPALNPDVVILDISLGDMTGFEVAKRLRAVGCRAKIIFLTVHEDIDFVRAAFDLGASGYVFKSRISGDLVNAIETVFRGGQFTSVSWSSEK